VLNSIIRCRSQGPRRKGCQLAGDSRHPENEPRAMSLRVMMNIQLICTSCHCSRKWFSGGEPAALKRQRGNYKVGYKWICVQASCELDNSTDMSYHCSFWGLQGPVGGALSLLLRARRTLIDMCSTATSDEQCPFSSAHTNSHRGVARKHYIVLSR
jgi:hypothetical protein